MLELNFTPFPELRTQRLLLRRLTNDDTDEMFFLRSNKDVLRYLGREPTKSVEEVRQFLESINKNIDKNESILWGISLANDKEKIIGTICLWNFNKENYRSEIGYLLHPAHWGKGIMKEAISRVIEYGFNDLNLHSIEAQLSPDNIASVSVLEKTGFVKEGHFKDYFYFRGKFSDTAVYSRLK